MPDEKNIDPKEGEPEVSKPKSPPPPDLSPPPAKPASPPAKPAPLPKAETSDPDSPPTSASRLPSGSPGAPEEAGEPGEPLDAGVAPGRVNFNTRVIAGLIDGLVALALYLAVIFVLPDVLNGFAWIISGAYWVVRDSLALGSFKGQSVGKMAMKLKVQKADGGDLVSDWQTALVRNVALIIPVFPLIELIVLLTREDKPEAGLRLGDEWAKTRVVAAPDAADPSDG